MKKTYYAPDMEIVNVETQQMLAASVGFGEGTMPGGNAAAPELDFGPDLGASLSGIPSFVFE